MISVADMRKSLRLTNNSLDDEIEATMDSCLEDLETSGIDTTNDTALMDNALKTYCRWHFNYEGKAEQYEKNYDRIVRKLSVSADYREDD